MESVLYQQPLAEVEYIVNTKRKQSLQMVPHVHRELEMICLLSGEGVAVADGVRTELHPGDIFISMPGQVHAYEKGKNETFVGCRVNPDYLPEYETIWRAGAPVSPVLVGVGNEEEIRDLLEKFAKTANMKDNPYRSNLRKGYLLTLFALLFSRMSFTGTSVKSDAVQQVIAYCNSHYCEDLCLESMERELHISRFTLSRLFHDKLNMGFNDYVNTLRITRACRLLGGGDEPVTDICMEVGFSTLRTFNRAFLKQTGVTPSAYRRNMREESMPPVKQEPPIEKKTFMPICDDGDDDICC